MRYLLLTSTDPAVNLATEEWLLRHGQGDVFMLWRNAPSIIVGRNQNTRAEINEAYVQAHGIPVIRRLTGGGAVFHDLGNVNFTCIASRPPGGQLDFRRFTAPVIEALAALGVACRFDGRNDLSIDGKKISGNAQCMLGDRVLHHGTLLFSASIADLSEALRINPLKYQDKAVKSVARRVTNISAWLPVPMRVEAFMRAVFDHMSGGRADAAQPLSPEEEAAVARLADGKYRTYDWNFGRSPRYAFARAARTPGGMLETHCDVTQGVITALRFYGEYFGARDVAALEARLVGCRHAPEALAARLAGVALEEYMRGIDAATLVASFF
ncbi:MAG TPA: lipoate--protein ligase [Solidesulfovibrio sp.]|nr:lipoate--protein ligase [Desulfovibrio sp.]HML59718.1 lipoate--protein ligase [Solidesulfovibrio sp.]